MHIKQFIIVGTLIASVFGMATIVQAKAQEGILTCGEQQYTVLGYGNREVMQVSGSTINYVVTYARIDQTGAVIIDIKGQQDKADIVTCTTTSPNTGNNLTLKGFFTPKGKNHDPEL